MQREHHLVEHGRPLVLLYLLVRVNADQEVVAHGLGLPQGVGMAEVDHVVAAVAPDPGLLLKREACDVHHPHLPLST